LIKILGISAFYHDSAAAITINGKVIAAAQEERFTRIKHTADFPINSIKYCLKESQLSLDDLDSIVFYDKPFLKFERLLETYYEFSPKGLISFLKAIPLWLKEKLFLKKRIFDGLKEIESYNKKKIKLLFTEHHLSHAASTFFSSPYQKSAILTIDGVGEWSTATIGIGENNKITIKKEMHFPHSVGLLYSAFTYFLGFKVNSGEYKLMGLAPFGNSEAEQTKNYIFIIKKYLIDIKNDGSIWMNQQHFNYAVGLKMVKPKNWEKLFGFPIKKTNEKIEQHHCNLAFAIQNVTEEIVFKMALEAKRITNCDNLCLAGGVALNCVSNGKLLKENIFKNIYIDPASNDCGGAIGAALATHYIYFNKNKEITPQPNTAYLGPEYSNSDIEIMNQKFNANFKTFEYFNDLSADIAQKIANGNIIGWFQGRMEFGPRALGNRSILGDPRNSEMQKKINLKIKYRESFRPFAPSILEEDIHHYFNISYPSPYMLLTAPLKKEKTLEPPKNYNNLNLLEKLNTKRSDIQAVTHVDFSARIQTVNKISNPRYWKLINEFKKLTNYSLLINTSFNVRGEPIVCTPEDAYRCFMNTDMDYLVINDFVYCKTDQPSREDKEKWQTKFKDD
jgi:carbamoyltransferase